MTRATIIPIAPYIERRDRLRQYQADLILYSPVAWWWGWCMAAANLWTER